MTNAENIILQQTKTQIFTITSLTMDNTKAFPRLAARKVEKKPKEETKTEMQKEAKTNRCVKKATIISPAGEPSTLGLPSCLCLVSMFVVVCFGDCLLACCCHFPALPLQCSLETNKRKGALMVGDSPLSPIVCALLFQPSSHLSNISLLILKSVARLTAHGQTTTRP
jgi:hypothetical protein